MASGITSSLRQAVHGVREYLSPVLSETRLRERGVLTVRAQNAARIVTRVRTLELGHGGSYALMCTPHMQPEEFVLAGDHLVRLAPSWSWCSSDDAHTRPYLPRAKQFLVTRNVPCHARVAELATPDERVAPEGRVGDEDEWVAPAVHPLTGTHTHTHTDGDAGDDVEEIPSSTPASASAAAAHAPAAPVVSAASSDDAYSDMDMSADAIAGLLDTAHAGMQGLVVTDSAAVSSSAPGGGERVSVRTYELSITYDNYYKTPRVWMRGFAPSGAPLTPEDMLEDVMQDYANRTATIEVHPYIDPSVRFLSIHPCRHAAAMKRILDAMSDGEEGADRVTAETYMFIFLKFIASMIPTVEYDYTMAVTV